MYIKWSKFKCIKVFIKYIKNNKLSIETLTDLNISNKLVELIKTNDPELQYLCIYYQQKIVIHLKHIKVIQNSNDNEIIHSVMSILSNITKENANILIENNIFKYLLLLCKPNTNINTLIIISQIISHICQFKELTNENINEISKCLSVLIMYNIDDILTSTIYAYNQLFTYFVLPNHTNKIDMNCILNGVAVSYGALDADVIVGIHYIK